MNFVKATRVMSERDIGYDEARKYFADLMDRAAAKGLRDETEIERLRAAIQNLITSVETSHNMSEALGWARNALNQQQRDKA